MKYYRAEDFLRLWIAALYSCALAIPLALMMWVQPLPVVHAQGSSINWTNITPPGGTWPPNGGYGSLSGVFDPLSGDMIEYTQWSFTGTVSVTNGSPTVTWVSGEKFSVIWHNPNHLFINAVQVTIASGTFPSSCGSTAISCTSLTLSANWAGATGTFSYTANVSGGHPADSSIYNDCFVLHNLATNTITRTQYCWGAMDNLVTPDNNSYGIPEMRQNSGMWGGMDTKRHLIMLGGGVNQAYAQSGITTNGTATIVNTTPSSYFVQGSMWVGMTVGFPSAVPTTKCTITAVTSEVQMTVGSCTAGFPNGITTLQYYPTELTKPVGGQDNMIYDMWYLSLFGNPQNDALTQISVPSWSANLDLKNDESWTWDSDDDAWIMYSAANGHPVWAFCQTLGNPGGTLTSAQTAVGCSSANTWIEVTGISGTPLQGYIMPSLFYDASHKTVWMYGFGIGAPTTKITDVYKYVPATKTWAAMSSVNQPAATTNCKQFMSEVTFIPRTGTLFYHLPDNTTDYSWSVATNTWTTVTHTGTPPSGCQYIGYDSSRDMLLEISQGSPYDYWQASLSTQPTISIPLTVQEALYCGDLTGHTCGAGAVAGGIARTNESFCAGVPIADATQLVGTGYLALSGVTASQFRVEETWPDGYVKWLNVCGTVASVSAGSTATVTLTNSGSGSTGGMVSQSAGVTTVNTTGGTCGSGSADCFTLVGTLSTPGGFDGIDTATIGSTSLVTTGTSSGFVVAGPANPATDCGTATPCTTLYESVNDTGSYCNYSYDGPVEALLVCNYGLKDGSGNQYMTGTSYFYFRNGSANVRVVSTLKNAAYGTNNTFATAFKAMQAYEFRMGSNLGAGTLNWNIGNHTGISTPTTGTMTGTDSVYIYQGLNITFGDGNWSNCGSPCTAYTQDVGYVIKKNGTASQTGTNAQAPVGYADLSNVSSAGIEIGQFFMAGLGPKSLEFQSGGNGTDAIRLGLYASENTYPVYLAWPQWKTDEFYLNFRTAAPASIPNEFIKMQQPLVSRAAYTQYNSAGVFFYPISSPLEEDTFYYNTVTAASPAVTTASGCAGGASYATLGCIFDVGTQTPSQWPLYMYSDAGYNYSQGGGRDQIDWRYAWMLNFATRGHTGRYLQTKQFMMMQIDSAMSHADFTGGWRSKPVAQLDPTGRPGATSTQPSGTCNVDATGLNVTLASGAYFGPWWAARAMTINGSNYTTGTITSPTTLTLSSAVTGAPLTGVACSMASAVGSSLLRSWGTGNPDGEHTQWWSIETYYEMTGAQWVYDGLRNQFDDYNLNLYNAHSGVIGVQTSGVNVIGTGNTSGTTLTTTSGTMLSTAIGQTVLIGGPLSASLSNFLPYTVTAVAGTSITISPAAPTLVGATWSVFGGDAGSRAVGLAITNAARYSQFLAANGDPADAAIALQQAKNEFYSQVKPPLCMSGYPSGCVFGSISTGPWSSQGISTTRGANYYSSDIGVGHPTCDPTFPDVRAQSPFQHSILIQALGELQAVAGTGWSDYATAGDLLSGMLNWNLTEGANYDGTASWTNNGLRYYVLLDNANCPSDATHYPVKANQTVWMPFYFSSGYYGAQYTPLSGYSGSWLQFFKETLQRVMSSNPAGAGVGSYQIDVGGYQLSAVIYQINHGSTNALQTQTITSFTDNGGGSYTLGWSTPASATALRGKWAISQIVDWIGFNPVTNAFTGSPSTTQNWFASTEIASMPSPVAGPQTVTVTGLPTGLTSANFMVKAMAPPQNAPAANPASAFAGSAKTNGNAIIH